MKVKEIMSKDIISIKPEDNAQEALELLFKMQISGLPVIDAQGKIVGMFTEKEVISAILPTYVAKVGRFIYQENPKVVKQKIHALHTTKAANIMRKEVITVDEDTTLCEVARVMLTEKARRLPVLDKTGKVIGIVARGDVLKALVKEETATHTENKI